jgi:hypothetical protein
MRAKLAIAVVLFVTSLAAIVYAQADPTKPGIIHINNGILRIEVPTNVPCYIEWASHPNGPWRSDWFDLRGIVSSTGIAEVRFPMFYRVTRVAEPNNLVAYYPFNGDANDASGNGHDATLFNGATVVTNGKFGGALQLDGTNDYGRVSASSAFLMTNFTLSAWVCFDAVPTGTTEAMPIISTMTGSLSNGGMQMDLLYEKRFYMEFRSSTQFNYAYASNGVFSVEDISRWRMLTSTCAWSNGLAHARLYLDGYPIADYDAATQPMAYNNQILYIGVQYDSRVFGGSWKREFKGKIDEVRIYNRCLTDNEVLSLYTLQR